MIQKAYGMIDPDSELPDMTPVFVDAVIKAFRTKLCCTVNPIAVVYKKIVCQDCFERLRASYSRDTWDIGGTGGTD